MRCLNGYLYFFQKMCIISNYKKKSKRPITKYIEKGSKVLSTLEPFSIYKLS